MQTLPTMAALLPPIRIIPLFDRFRGNPVPISRRNNGYASGSAGMIGPPITDGADHLRILVSERTCPLKCMKGLRATELGKSGRGRPPYNMIPGLTIWEMDSLYDINSCTVGQIVVSQMESHFLIGHLKALFEICDPEIPVKSLSGSSAEGQMGTSGLPNRTPGGHEIMFKKSLRPFKRDSEPSHPGIHFDLNIRCLPVLQSYTARAVSHPPYQNTKGMNA